MVGVYLPLTHARDFLPPRPPSQTHFSAPPTPVSRDRQTLQSQSNQPMTTFVVVHSASKADAMGLYPQEHTTFRSAAPAASRCLSHTKTGSIIYYHYTHTIVINICALVSLDYFFNIISLWEYSITVYLSIVSPSNPMCPRLLNRRFSPTITDTQYCPSLRLSY